MTSITVDYVSLLAVAGDEHHRSQYRRHYRRNAATDALTDRLHMVHRTCHHFLSFLWGGSGVKG